MKKIRNSWIKKIFNKIIKIQIKRQWLSKDLKEVNFDIDIENND